MPDFSIPIFLFTFFLVSSLLIWASRCLQDHRDARAQRQRLQDLALLEFDREVLRRRALESHTAHQTHGDHAA
jgi:hypothetical protein